jgi:hypothetical protein
MIGQLRLTLGRSDDHARHGARDVPVLERQHGPDDEPHVLRELERRPLIGCREGQPF